MRVDDWGLRVDLTVHHPTIRLYHTNQLPSIAHIIRPFGYTTIPSIDWHQSTSSDQSVIPHHSIGINPHHPTYRLYDHSVIRLASIAIDCPGFTPWAGSCRTFGACRWIFPDYLQQHFVVVHLLHNLHFAGGYG